MTHGIDHYSRYEARPGEPPNERRRFESEICSAEYQAERARAAAIREIEERMKTREEMTLAMMSVKRDDWEIVNIEYTDGVTDAVAFVKRGTPLKPNMKPTTRTEDDNE